MPEVNIRCTFVCRAGSVPCWLFQPPRDWLFSGSIFFCYNDYRTHVGDKGKGALKQRVHGVVDLYGARKPSYEVLRAESSPIERMAVVKKDGGILEVTIETRKTLPAYTLRDYTIKWINRDDYHGVPFQFPRRCHRGPSARGV